MNDNIRQKFTDYQKDNETNLDFAEARMYQNLHGRFTAIDPLLASGKSANPQTFNPYVYAMNNLIMLTDPTGLQAGSFGTILIPPNTLNEDLTSENYLDAITKDSGFAETLRKFNYFMFGRYLTGSEIKEQADKARTVLASMKVGYGQDDVFYRYDLSPLNDLQILDLRDRIIKQKNEGNLIDASNLPKGDEITPNVPQSPNIPPAQKVFIVW